MTVKMAVVFTRHFVLCGYYRYETLGLDNDSRSIQNIRRELGQLIFLHLTRKNLSVEVMTVR